MQKQLYVLRFRGFEWKSLRPLTEFDRLAGWRDRNYGLHPDPCKVYHHGGRTELCVANEGHERGSLHSRTGPHVLSWTVAPGDEILAVLSVDLYRSVQHEDGSRSWKAYCDPWCRSPDGDYFHVRCDTVLGRSVQLGEDGAEGAFGHDAIRAQIEEALFADDFRKLQCECALTFIEGDLPDSIKIELVKTAAQLGEESNRD